MCRCQSSPRLPCICIHLEIESTAPVYLFASICQMHAGATSLLFGEVEGIATIHRERLVSSYDAAMPATKPAVSPVRSTGRPESTVLLPETTGVVRSPPYCAEPTVKYIRNARPKAAASWARTPLPQLKIVLFWSDVGRLH